MRGVHVGVCCMCTSDVDACILLYALVAHERHGYEGVDVAGVNVCVDAQAAHIRVLMIMTSTRIRIRTHAAAAAQRNDHTVH